MPTHDLPNFDVLDEPIYLSNKGRVRASTTETIDLAPLMAELSVSGSFDFREIETTSIGKLLEALPIPSLLISVSGSIIFANQAWEQISPAYRTRLHRPFRELFPNPSMSRKVESIVRSVFSTRKSQVIKGVMEIERQQIWGRVHFRPLRMGGERAVLVLVEDLTLEKQQLLLLQKHQVDLRKEIVVRKSAEAAMKASEQRMRVLVEVSPIGIGIMQRGACVYANTAFMEIFAYGNGDSALGALVENLIDPEYRQLMSLCLANEGSGESAATSFEGKGVKKNGDKFDITVWQRRILYFGEPAIMIFVADTSEAKELRSQLLQAQKMEAVGTLAGGIAHDFNNLLTVIQGCSELILLKKGADPEPQARRVLEACRKGTDMVQALLAFSRKVDPTLSPLDLNDEIEQFRGLVERMLPKMIHIDLHLAGDVATISGNRTQIEQILMNLAVNAKDAMPDGGTLTIETRNVVPGDDCCQTIGKDISWVLLSVSDTGHGIEKEVIEHIFEPFFTTKETGKGTGLGLATVYGIVKQHNGHIRCDSQPGKGATFHVYFPVTDQQEQARPEPKAETPSRGGSETILFVDDEDQISEMVQEFLTDTGYTVLIANDGKTALELYRREVARINLVILDLIMPQMSGAQCLEKLIEMNPRVKVLIASGYTGGRDMPNLPESWAGGFIKKPYGLAEMLGAIRAVLDSATDNRPTTLDLEAPMPKKKRIDALEALLDLRDGMTHPQLIAKYGLSLPELASLLKKLRQVRTRYSLSDAVLDRMRHRA